MKKRFKLSSSLKVILSAFGLIIGMSCTDYFESKDTDVKVEFDHLNNELAKMTQSFLQEHPQSAATRGWLDRLWNAVCADVDVIVQYNKTHHRRFFGFTIPIQSTCSASTLAYDDAEFVIPIYEDEAYELIHTVDSLSSIYYSKDNSKSYALTHNAVILDLIKNNSIDVGNLDNLVASIKTSANKLKIKHTDESVEETTAFVEQFLEGENDDFISEYDLYVDYLSQRAVDDYLDNVQSLSSPEDVKEYTEEYLSIMIESTFVKNLPSENKKMIEELIRMGCASYDMWYHLARLNIK